MRVDLGLEPVRCFLLSTRAARGIARTLVPSKAKALESDAQHPKFSLALQGVAGTQEPLDNIVILGTGHDVVAEVPRAARTLAYCEAVSSSCNEEQHHNAAISETAGVHAGKHLAPHLVRSHIS